MALQRVEHEMTTRIADDIYACLLLSWSSCSSALGLVSRSSYVTRGEALDQVPVVELGLATASV